ncbi:hypothetical protein D3C81_1303210 [compost metagenome]
MRLEVDLLDLRGDPDLAECLAARVGVLCSGANGAGFLAGLRRPTHIGVEHISHSAGNEDIDLVPNLEVRQSLRVFRKLERHIFLVIRAFYRDLAVGQVDGCDLRGDMAFQCLAGNRNIGSVHREAGSGCQRGQGNSTSE